MSEVLLTKRIEFAASHTYRNARWSEEKNRQVFGKLANPYGHGHNYLLEATVSGEVDKETGMAINIGDVKKAMQEIVKDFDHKNLNVDTHYFKGLIPTTENLALLLFRLLEKRLKGIRLIKVRVYEDEDLYVEVTDE
jgi:6-pyruvoyltetrahydropterin/6-carboxytetrahydropterin synthase